MAATKLNIESKLLEAKDKLTQLGIEEELVSEIEWCLGSYAFDKNPDGLFEKTEASLKALINFKKKNDKKVSKKLIDELTRVLKTKK